MLFPAISRIYVLFLYLSRQISLAGSIRLHHNFAHECMDHLQHDMPFLQEG